MSERNFFQLNSIFSIFSQIFSSFQILVKWRPKIENLVCRRRQTEKSSSSPCLMATNWKIQFVAVRHGDEPKNPVCRHDSWRQMRNCQLLAINYLFFKENSQKYGVLDTKNQHFLVCHHESWRQTGFFGSSPCLTVTNWIFQFVAGDKQDFHFWVTISQEFEMN